MSGSCEPSTVLGSGGPLSVRSQPAPTQEPIVLGAETEREPVIRSEGRDFVLAPLLASTPCLRGTTFKPPNRFLP